MVHSNGFPTDYWAGGAVVSPAHQRVFVGLAGLQSLSGTVTLTALDTDVFRAQLSRLQVGHLAIERVDATAHQGRTTSNEACERPTPLLEVTVLLAGQVRISDDQGSFELAPGEVAITDTRRYRSYSSDSGFTSVRCVLDIDLVPPALQYRGTHFNRPLHATPLTESLTRAVLALLADPDRISPTTQVALLPALVDLATAALTEAQAEQDERPFPQY